jgi:hypothetical protein
MTDTITQFQLRNGTAANWTSSNPVLLEGEVGFESDTRKLKLGNGVSAWNDLLYVQGYDNPTFTTLATTGLATLPHIHGALAGPVYIHCRNGTGGTLAKGTPVYITGNVGDTATVIVAAADASDLTKMPAIGILDTALSAGADGHVVISGEITAMNTNGYAVNSALYVANGGGFTTTPPVNKQPIGRVTRGNSNTGALVVMGPGVVL